VAHAGLEVVARAFYAMHDTKTPLLVGGGAMLLNVGLSLCLPPLFESLDWFAHGGLALANSLATTLELVGLLWLIQGKLGGLEGGRSLPTLLRSAAAAGLMGVTLAALQWTLPNVSALWLGPLGIALGAGVYLGAAWVLGVDEVHAVTRRFRRMRVTHDEPLS